MYPIDRIPDPQARKRYENALAKAKAAPDKVRDESAELGTLAHECINEILSGREPEVPDEVRPAVYGAIDWSSEMGLEVVATESRIWHPVHRYAGTVDFIGRTGAGNLVVADWKRSPRVSTPNMATRWQPMPTQSRPSPRVNRCQHAVCGPATTGGRRGFSVTNAARWT